MGFLKREAGGGLFKLYRADVELSCPRTPEPTSDGQWEECPAAGSIMHFQHLKTMSVRSTTPSQNNSERPVDALAENGKLPTHLLTTSNQEMLAHLKIPFFCVLHLRFLTPPPSYTCYTSSL